MTKMLLVRESFLGREIRTKVVSNIQAGNRLTKVNVLGQETTLYSYDLQYPLFYGSQGNRLMESQTRNASNEVVQERFYLYDQGGRANYVIVKDDPMEPGPDGPIYTGTQIIYNTQGLAAVAWKVRWHLTSDGSAVDQSTLEYVSAMQYRYDGGRSRYLVQRSDPREYLLSGSYNTYFRWPWTPELGPGPQQWSASEGKWADYAGGEIRGDFSVTVSGSYPNQTATASNTMAHEPGLAQAPWTGASASGGPSEADVAYMHGNLIGSTERMTGAQDPQTADPPPVVRRAVFTAFGEPIDVAQPPSAVNSRYGYAGAWGYQGSSYRSSGDQPTTGDPLADLGWLHVGARYYDPAAGRFMQRDPIGMAGGPNTYIYCFNNPVNLVDPTGEFAWIAAGAAVGAAVNVGFTLAANGGSVTGQQLAAAAVSGAIAGGLGAAAGPLGGTIAQGIGLASTGLPAAIASGFLSALGSALGQAVANVVDPCNAINPLNAALYGGLGGGIAKGFFPTRNLNTWAQAQHFGARTFGGLFRTRNAWFNTGSLGTSSGIGGAANIPGTNPF